MQYLARPRRSGSMWVCLAALALTLLACDVSSLPIPGGATSPPESPTEAVTQAAGPASTPSRPPTEVPTSTVEVITEVVAPTGTAATPLPSGPTPTVPAGDQAQVTRIVDGDTFKATLNGAEVTVRYIGINTPEVGQPCADEATTADQTLVGGQTVTLVKDVSDTDQYGRLLRYVYAGNLFVNAELVRQGWAEAAKYPPDVAHATEFHDLAAAARDKNLGCWPTGVFGPTANGTLPTGTATTATTPAPTLTGGSPTATATTATPSTGTPATATPSSGMPTTAAVCDCSYNKYNCKDFANRAAAQACFDYCKSLGKGDIHMLDTNGNGIACENIP